MLPPFLAETEEGQQIRGADPPSETAPDLVKIVPAYWRWSDKFINGKLFGYLQQQMVPLNIIPGYSRIFQLKNSGIVIAQLKFALKLHLIFTQKGKLGSE